MYPPPTLDKAPEGHVQAPTDQKVGGSNPSERPPSPGRRGLIWALVFPGNRAARLGQLNSRPPGRTELGKRPQMCERSDNW